MMDTSSVCKYLTGDTISMYLFKYADNERWSSIERAIDIRERRRMYNPVD